MNLAITKEISTLERLVRINERDARLMKDRELARAYLGLAKFHRNRIKELREGHHTSD